MDDSAAPCTRLSGREHRYLWLMAQGHTPTEAGRLMGTTSTPALSTRVREKLGARTTAHAVWIAAQRELIGPYLDCGSLKGYQAHHGRHEDPCGACRRTFIDYTGRNGVPTRKVPLTEAELRLLRCYDSGRSFKQVLQTWGCSRRTLDDVRTSLYRKLDVAHLPQQSKHHAAREEGRRRGYLRPYPVLGQPTSEPRKWGTTALTELELRTLSALADGTSLSQAGRILGGISGAAVSSRLARVYKKLDVLDRAHGERREAAVKEARSRGYAL